MKYYYLKRHEGIFYYLQHGKRKYGYRFTYYNGQHKRHEKSSRGFTTQKEAIKQRNLIAQRYGDLKANTDITFGQWCNNFLIRMKPIKKITTYKSYYNILHHDVLPYLSEIKLIDIRPMTYKYDCLTRLLKYGLSRKTVINVNARVQAVMNDAVRNKYLEKNQLAHTKIPYMNQRPRKEIMNDMQLHKFNKCLDQQSLQIQAIYYTLEGTGMRAGELLGLKYSDLDLNHNLIYIKRTRDEYGARSPKTPHSRRTVMITNHLANVLSKYHQYCKKHFKVTFSSYVILGKQGKPLIPNLVSIELKQLLIEAGLKDMVGKFTPHSFRHMIVSRLIDAGIKPTAVSKMMGHANVGITLSVYAESAPNEMIDMNKALKKIQQHESNV